MYDEFLKQQFEYIFKLLKRASLIFLLGLGF